MGFSTRFIVFVLEPTSCLFSWMKFFLSETYCAGGLKENSNPHTSGLFIWATEREGSFSLPQSICRLHKSRIKLSLSSSLIEPLSLTNKLPILVPAGKTFLTECHSLVPSSGIDKSSHRSSTILFYIFKLAVVVV